MRTMEAVRVGAWTVGAGMIGYLGSSAMFNYVAGGALSDAEAVEAAVECEAVYQPEVTQLTELPDSCKKIYSALPLDAVIENGEKPVPTTDSDYPAVDAASYYELSPQSEYPDVSTVQAQYEKIRLEDREDMETGERFIGGLCSIFGLGIGVTNLRGRRRKVVAAENE